MALSLQGYVESLRIGAINGVGEVLSGVVAAVLLDVPTIANWGDNLIWAGERVALDHLGVRLAGKVDAVQYDKGTIDRHLDRSGCLLLHGGGNFGDLYPARMSSRLRVVSENRDRKIIQLPQSIRFLERQALEEHKRVIGEHPDFSLLVRDTRSLEFARKHFDCHAALIPDMAFALGSMDPLGAPTAEVLWITRNDAESVGNAERNLGSGYLVADWSAPPYNPILRARDLTIPSLHSKLMIRGSKRGEQIRRWFTPRIVQSRLRLANRFVSQGEMIVTERLHGHIMASLLGLPTVMVENRIGKLGDFSRTWVDDVDLVRFVESPAEVLKVLDDFPHSNSR